MKRSWWLVLLAACLLLFAGCSDVQSARDNVEDSGPEKAAATVAAGNQPVVSPAGATNNPSGKTAAPAASASEIVARPEGWTEETHGDGVDPNYEVVFPQDKVNQITITISPENWQAMQANMTSLFGQPGSGRQGGAPAGGFAPPDRGQRQIPPRPEEGALPQGQFPQGQLPQSQLPQGQLPQGQLPGVQGAPGGVGGRGLDMTPENPMWVPATIEFEGNTWTNVGVRYKGNSSLRSTWGSGSPKLPLKFDFDEFEDDYAEIQNQRFYGFKQLSLASGFGDSTYMREAVAYDLLEEAGLVAAKTAYYEVYLDYGEGKTRLGLYVVVEVIDDTVIKRYFDDDSGNIYEGDGAAASLANGVRNQIQSSFLKENNEKQADWSDIEALYDVLHSEERTANPTAWRAKLESIFDVDTFVRWLAISATIQHWDAYGAMAHNYYLYNDPESGRLTWISWDHNLILSAGGGGAPGIGAGAPGGGMGGRGNTSLDKQDVGANWPLIRYLLDEPTYYALYIEYLEETVNGAFATEKMEAKYQELAKLLEPYAAEEGSQQSFQAAVQSLTQATRDRAKAVNDFLLTQASGSR